MRVGGDGIHRRHSVTLALAVTGALNLPTALIEFLIPVTILATALENLIVRDRSTAIWGCVGTAVFAGLFGLVHGAGFANYLRSLLWITSRRRSSASISVPGGSAS